MKIIGFPDYFIALASCRVYPLLFLWITLACCLLFHFFTGMVQNFGDLPLEAARRYGDRYFTAMMLAKVVCVQLVSVLGYSLLFQDVDLVWFKHPLDFFKNVKDDFDIYFQDDGGHSLRYAPYRSVSNRLVLRLAATPQLF